MWRSSARNRRTPSVGWIPGPEAKTGCPRTLGRATVAAVLIRRELPADVDAIHAVHRAAFDTALEADLVHALRADAGWLPELSFVAADDTDGPVLRPRRRPPPPGGRQPGLGPRPAGRGPGRPATGFRPPPQARGGQGPV